MCVRLDHVPWLRESGVLAAEVVQASMSSCTQVNPAPLNKCGANKCGVRTEEVNKEEQASYKQGGVVEVVAASWL